MNRAASSLQRIGLALLAVSAVCGYTAFDAYREAMAAAKLLSEEVAIMTFRATVPRESYMMGGIAVVLTVAALRCLVQARVARQSEPSDLMS